MNSTDNIAIAGIGVIKVNDGKSAYQIAVENDFISIESEWLESLKVQDYVLTEEDKHEIA